MSELIMAWSALDAKREFRVEGWRFWLELVPEGGEQDRRVVASWPVLTGKSVRSWTLLGELAP